MQICSMCMLTAWLLAKGLTFYIFLVPQQFIYYSFSTNRENIHVDKINVITIFGSHPMNF